MSSSPGTVFVAAAFAGVKALTGDARFKAAEKGFRSGYPGLNLNVVLWDYGHVWDSGTCSKHEIEAGHVGTFAQGERLVTFRRICG